MTLMTLDFADDDAEIIAASSGVAKSIYVSQLSPDVVCVFVVSWIID